MNEDEKAILADLFSVVEQTLDILARHINDKELKKDRDELSAQMVIVHDMKQLVEDTLLR